MGQSSYENGLCSIAMFARGFFFYRNVDGAPSPEVPRHISYLNGLVFQGKSEPETRVIFPLNMGLFG